MLNILAEGQVKVVWDFQTNPSLSWTGPRCTFSESLSGSSGRWFLRNRHCQLWTDPFKCQPPTAARGAVRTTGVTVMPFKNWFCLIRRIFWVGEILAKFPTALPLTLVCTASLMSLYSWTSNLKDMWRKQPFNFCVCPSIRPTAIHPTSIHPLLFSLACSSPRTFQKARANNIQSFPSGIWRRPFKSQVTQRFFIFKCNPRKILYD